ncbi:MAG: hypothetical protein EOM06_03485 [Sphingobacteriia bacterium]|nr:hypothetical protein [Sphingobacteriia bacterium]
MKLKVYQMLNIAGFIFLLAVNFLANALPIGGKTTGEVSASIPSLFTPAGFTFSIWGVIYLLLAAFVIYQAKGLFINLQHEQNRFLYRIDIWFFVSCLANIAWIFAWHHELIWFSLLLILGLLGSLLMIYYFLGAGRRIISRKEHFFVHVPFSIYLGWVSVAVIANMSVLLVDINWGKFGLSDVFWTVVMVVVASLLGVFALLSRKDYFFSLVIVWALFGIISKRLTDTSGSDEEIVFTAVTGILVILTLLVFIAVRHFLKKPRTEELSGY